MSDDHSVHHAEHDGYVSSDIRNVARWGRQAAEALDHAHKMGVVHRDVKPSNMIVDTQGDLWLTDFGLAQVADSPSVTMTGDLMGTLRYLSPEQAMARRIPMDHRTDIYSLGISLYELFAGEPAFPETDRAELLRRIIFESPRPLRRARPEIPRPLQTIVHKAIEKNPADRYATAQEFADDLQRFLDDEPIHAKPPSLLEHAARWSRRNRQLVAAGVLLLLVAAAVGWLMAGRLKVERDAVAKARDAATQSERKAQHNEWRSLVTQIGLTRHTDRAGRRDEAFQLIDRAVELGHDLHIDEPDKKLLRDEVIASLALQDDLSLIRRNTHETSRVHLEFSPRGDRYARTGVEAGIEIHDASGRLEFRLPPPFDGTGSSTLSIFGPAGRWLIVQHLASSRNQIVVWDLTAREIVFTVPMEPGLPYSDFSHDGTQFITFVDVAHLTPGTTVAADSAGEVRIIDLNSREQVRSFALPFVPINTISGPHPNQVTFLKSAAPHTEISIWDITSGAAVTSFLLPDERSTAAWSRGGRWLAAGQADGSLIVWDALQQRVTPIRREQVRIFGFSPDDRLLAIETRLEETEFWDLPKAHLATTSVGRFSRFVDEGNEVALYDSLSVSQYRIHRGDEFRRIDLPLPKGDLISQIEFSGDGRTLVAVSSSGVNLIDLATGQRRLHHATNCYSAVLGRYHEQPALFCGTYTGIELLPFTSDSRQLGPMTMLHNGAFRSAQRYLAATPDGRTVAAIIDHQQVRVWHNEPSRLDNSPSNADQSDSAVTIQCEVPVSFVAISPDGGRIATSAFHGAGVRLWDTHTGKQLRDLWPAAVSAQSTFGPDNRTLLIAESRRFRIMDTTTGESLWDQSRTDASDAPGAYAISPTRPYFAVTPSNHEIRLFDMQTQQELAIVSPTDRATNGPLKFSPDGRLLVRGSGAVVEIWNLERLAEELRRRDIAFPR
ncbi:MAG: serine/threonine-protein kinase [Planctomycetia bacterium]|nr:serine/threonine-protein kinase [Planctomycetia bacterium]